MKILFVWLNNDTPVGFSHGLAVLSAELKAAGHQVELLHVNEQLGMPFDLERIGRRLAQRQPHLVGLSFGSNHAAVAAAVARQTRAVLPDSWIVAGGVHTTIYPEQVIECIERHRGLGCSLFVIEFFGRDTKLPARLFAEKVIPAFRA